MNFNKPKTLNVQYLASNSLIDLIFIHMIEQVISILHIKYLSNLIILMNFNNFEKLRPLLHSIALYRYGTIKNFQKY